MTKGVAELLVTGMTARQKRTAKLINIASISLEHDMAAKNYSGRVTGGRVLPGGNEAILSFRFDTGHTERICRPLRPS